MTGKEPIDLPTTMEKRELLYGDGAPPAELVRLGELYLAAGKPDEAAHFFLKAGETKRLERLAEDALAAGDAFAFDQVRGMLGKSPTPDEWFRLAEAARRSGKELFAKRAEGTGRREGAAKKDEAGSPASG